MSSENKRESTKSKFYNALAVNVGGSTVVNEVVKISEEDQKFIDASPSDEMRVKRRAMITMFAIFNGELDRASVGVSKSYIKREEFRVKVTGMAGTAHQVLESALNWAACGKGQGGAAAAMIRWQGRNLYDDSRETRIVDMVGKDLDATQNALVEEYLELADRTKGFSSHLAANIQNIGGLAGALMMSISHHWDAANKKPQTALISALGLKDDVSSDDFRKIFYLSIHPLPLRVIEEMRQEAALGSVEGYSEAVKIRAMGIPAGYGALNITHAALSEIKVERYGDAIFKKFKDLADEMDQLVFDIQSNPTAYHVLATDYGVQRKTAKLDKFKPLMIIGAAYAITVVRGTLGEAQSIKKFVTQNQRAVSVWSEVMKKEAEKSVSSVEDLLGKMGADGSL